MRSEQRILTSHVGSLVRPPELVDALKKRAAGSRDDGALGALLDRTVAEVVARQAETGLDIVNDGEFGKTMSWSRYVLDRLEGFEMEPERDHKMTNLALSGQDRRDFADFYAEYEKTQVYSGTGQWHITGPIRYRPEGVNGDIARLKRALAAAPGTEGFLAAVAPASLVPSARDEHYAGEEERLYAIADALHEEYKAIVDAGLILQVDDAYLATYYDVIVPPGTLADFRKWAALRIDVLNHALRDLPAERTRYHVCWGSWNGPHTTDVAFRDIADLVLKVRVGGYALEMANPRHAHEWRVWEDVRLPEGRVLVPGVISHATNIVEHPELVAERITQLAGLVGRENVIASTDCGFAQGPFIARVHASIMWAKLAALTEGARIASGRLWPKAA
jgi:5-methyltetrahydropteroyltriglutamate--homocysteine methyltransferase